jgi:hypothetical protein
MLVWFIKPDGSEPLPVPHAVNSRDATIASVTAKILGVFSMVALFFATRTCGTDLSQQETAFGLARLS